tara:strand:+ start:53 stop:805 length:753 start_codon:yes stop_codon:yes gene_type:complete
MSAKKIADYIFEGTGRGVNALMNYFGLSKSATAKLSPDQLARVVQQKGTQFYKDTNKAKNIDTGKLFYGATSVGAVLSNIWNEFDPTKVKRMGDGTLRAENLKKKKNDVKKKVAKKTPPKAPPKKPKDLIDKMSEKTKQEKKTPKKVYMKEGKTGKDSKVEFKAVKGNVGMLASKKDLKAVPTRSKGKGLSKLPTPVRNKMGFMYGGGMPMPSKKPRMSTTDYRKASKGMLIISIDMKKKKPKTKKNKRG